MRTCFILVAAAGLAPKDVLVGSALFLLNAPRATNTKLEKHGGMVFACDDDIQRVIL